MHITLLNALLAIWANHEYGSGTLQELENKIRIGRNRCTTTIITIRVCDDKKMFIFKQYILIVPGCGYVNVIIRFFFPITFYEICLNIRTRRVHTVSRKYSYGVVTDCNRNRFLAYHALSRYYV